MHIGENDQLGFAAPVILKRPNFGAILQRLISSFLRRATICHWIASEERRVRLEG